MANLGGYYLGDGVMAFNEGWQIKLVTDGNKVVCLDLSTYFALKRYAIEIGFDEDLDDGC